ncbi:MAG TPA: cation-transporting P-type ATPase [Acidimicrobiales bacterium]|nr:cation-transporting P-type ATPase [Acidimicrobiales bacterium]
MPHNDEQGERSLPVSAGSGASGDGLSDAEALRRRSQSGPNKIPEHRATPVWRRFARQLVQFFALMLWVAGVLSFAVGEPALGIAIFSVIVINATFAFAQEFRAERAAQGLRDLLPRRATVIRERVRREIDAADLVVGDLVVLRSGDRISADMTVRQSQNLSIDTSMLSGESVPNATQVGDPLFAGCFVVGGEATAVVEAVGAHTRLAAISSLTQREHRPRSPLEHELGHVVHVIALIAVAVGVSFFVLSLLIGASVRDGFLFAVGVTVALVPEGLLPTVTLSLAVGAQTMARHHALVRRLESVETLGSTTFICVDKTGTITHNQMSVIEVWMPSGSATIAGVGYEPTGTVSALEAPRAALSELARAGARCSQDRAVERNGQWIPDGDPTEAALFALARRVGVDVDADVASSPLVRQIPFDEHRRMMSVIIDGQVLVKGAPENVLARSARCEGAQHALEQMTRRGLRVLAVAARPLGSSTPDASASQLESQLRLLGFVGIEDPPREGVREALVECRADGIRVAMLTGDNPETARAIAQQVGLIPEGGLVVIGADLPSDAALLGAMLDREDGVVISRVTPEDKLRIALALQQRGHVVAMTGDGVNDGPALQAADIGVAMGENGTDVARAAADLVLLDDNFTTIFAAVRHGRITFSNMRRFLTYHLVSNVAELTPFVIWALSGGRFPLALGVLQILSFDVGSDILPALALGVEHGPAVLHQPLSGRHLIDRQLLTRVFVVLGLSESVLEMTAFTLSLVALGWLPGHAFPDGAALRAASGSAFAAVVMGQIGAAFACRSSSRWPGRLGWTSNRLLIVGVAVSLGLLATLLFVKPLASLLGQGPPPLVGWVVAFASPPIMLGVDALHKRVRRRFVVTEQPRTFTVLAGAHRVPPA